MKAKYLKKAHKIRQQGKTNIRLNRLARVLMSQEAVKVLPKVL
ncbi:MAG: hypothetical protein ABEK17_03800 [Candidatus Aenigmatarchaeota archaeon]